MKKRIIFIVVGIAALVILIYLNMYVKGSDMPDYSVFSTNDKGASLVYDTLKKLGYPIEISYRRVDKETNINNICIIIEPDSNHFTSDDVTEVEQWVLSGGSLLYLGSTENSFYRMIVKHSVYPFGTFGYSSVGLGEIVVGRSDGLLNLDIISQKSNAYELARLLYDDSMETIFFCEYYHGFKQSPTIWYTMPTSYKALTVQFLLVVILLLWMLGKRFGRPTPYYEEIEREDTEYLNALANVYRNAGMGNVITDILYDEFLRKCSGYFDIPVQRMSEEIANCWKTGNLEHYDLLLYVKEKVEKKYNTKKRREAAECIKVMDDISKLNKALQNA